MSKGIKTITIAVRRRSKRQGWEIGHRYAYTADPTGGFIMRYSAFKLPDEIQRRIAVLDMVALGDTVPGVGVRLRLYFSGTTEYSLDPWCPFEELLATGLLKHIKE